MTVDSNRLSNMLSIISGQLMEKKISCCVIGAMALGLFGLPRYTSGLDLLAGESDWKQINPVMKLMAIANNQDRALQDESDISELFNLMKGKLLPDLFLPLNTEKIYSFADRFGQRPVVRKYLTTKTESDSGNHWI